VFIAYELLVAVAAYEADKAVLLYDALTAFDAVILIEGIAAPTPVSNSLPLICTKY
jgi:hypothetical protein